MITLQFHDGLVNNRFARYNDFDYHDLASTGIYYKYSEEEVPFIMRSTSIENHKFHKDGELMYSVFDKQLRGRVLTTNRIKEILDGAKVPLIFKIGRDKFLIGKGFLASFTAGNINVLFIAVARRNAQYVEDVKYYVSRAIYGIGYKKVYLAIKDFISIHKGEVLITNNIEQYIGSKIEIPEIRTINERRLFNQSLLEKCAKEYATEFKTVSVQMLPEDAVKKKKETEAAILEQIRSGSVEDVEDYDDYEEDDYIEGDV